MEIVRMPKMSDTMTEGVVVKWHKKVGDTIKNGDLVAEIETDKATMEFESYQAGTLLYTGIEEGKAAPVDAILAILGKPGEDYKEFLEKEMAATKRQHLQQRQHLPVYTCTSSCTGCDCESGTCTVYFSSTCTRNYQHCKRR